MQKRRTRIAAVAMALTLSLTAPALAGIGVNLNGEPLTFDVPPVVETGRTLVPVRAIFEALGARISWDEASQTISAVHPERDRYVIMTLGSTTAWVDGQEVTLEVPPRLVDGRTMVPLRFVSTALDAKVDWDPATETVLITQAPLTPATTEATTPVDGRALSRYTRAMTYTHLNEAWNCAIGTPNRFEDFAYGYEEGDEEYLEYARPYLAETVACWQNYATDLLPTLSVPVGAEAAQAELQRLIDLHQEALAELQRADAAHLKGEQAERDRRFQAGVQALLAAFDQEDTMLAAMDAITSPDPEFLTVSEHAYVLWLDEMMGYTDSCFSQLRMIRHTEGMEQLWTDYAAQCMTELPADLSDLIPPTDRMKALQRDVLAQLAPFTKRFTALSAQVNAGDLTGEALEAEIDALHTAWIETVPTWNQLFVYRNWGK